MSLLLEILSGEISPNITYQVVGGTSITYNSTVYSAGSVFVGVSGIDTYIKTGGTEIVYEATHLNQLAVGFDQGKYLGLFNDTTQLNQLALGGEIVHYPGISGSIEIRQNDQNYIPVETKYLMDQVYVTTRVPNFAQGLTYDQIIAEAISIVNLSTTIEPISNITKVTISDYDGYMRYDRSYIGGDMNISYSNGTVETPVQGEIATYSFLVSNNGYGGTAIIDVDFGGTIGTEQVTLYLAAFTTKTVTIEKTIPLTETGTLTVNVSDDVGSVEYNVDYEIWLIISYTIDTIIGYTISSGVVTEFGNPIQYVNWGDGTIDTNVSTYHVYTQALSDITVVVATTSDDPFVSFRNTVRSLNADNYNSTITSVNVSSSGPSLNSRMTSLDLSTYPLVNHVDTLWQTSLRYINLDNTLITSYSTNRTSLADGLFLRNCPNLLSVAGDNRGAQFTMDVTGSSNLSTINTSYSYIYSVVGLETTNISYVRIDMGLYGGTSELDVLLSACVVVGNSNGYFEVYAVPDAQGDLNILTLQDRGWTVLTS